MEIQGPNDTKNTKCQHGALVNTPGSQCESALEARRRILKPNLSLSLGSESDKLKRSRSTPLRTGENGSGCDRPLRNNRCEKSDVPPANAELSDVAVFKKSVFRESESLPSELDELKEHELVMAIPYTEPVNLEQRHPPEKVPSPEELYVVFNIVHNDEDKRHSAFQPKAEAGGVSSPAKSNISHTESSLEERNPSRSQLSTQSVSRRCHQNGSLETEQQEPLLSDGYSEASQTPKLPGVEMKDHVDPPEEFLQCVSSSSSAFTPENRADDELSITGQEVTGNMDSVPEAAPISVHEAFSGTIMINDQSIIVTIENGVLTLASSPEGYVYKDDGAMSSKEQTGICEDQVLLNQDGGTKSDRKVSNVTQDEPKSQLLTLTDNCSLSEMAVSSAIKQEGITGSVETVNGVCQPGTSKVQKNPLAGYSKKNSVVKFACPHPGCSCTFDSRQNLKIHVVLHTGGQRPFKCTVKGCDWSFTTSYKLKRHLQSHEQVRPFQCAWENCGRRFTTIYNLKAHVRVHDQENSFVCEVCNERFRTATRLTNHQRTHFEPERPHKCEFPGCEKTFITFSALFSHNRTHFREIAQFTCTFPGCEKRYDKACRLKIHLRSHTGERPFVCDSDACGWTFTSMSKLLRHKRKHDDDRRFSCPEEGCGKSFTRAEHLKGHSITHLGTKPFECPVESCNAKFSARSSLYIHSKKHKQDGVSLRSRCPVAGCTKHFLSRSSLKTHMLKHHNLSPDVLNQLDCAATLTPSSELTSTSQQVAASPGPVAPDLAGLDLSTLFSGIPTCPGAAVSVAGEGGSVAASFSMDMHLVNTGIITIDPTLVEPALGVAKPVEPLILTAGHVLDAAGAGGVLPHATLHLDDVQTVNPDELGTLTALTVRSSATSEHDHSPLTSESSMVSALAPPLSSTMSYPGAPVPELQPPQEKAELPAAESPVVSLMSRMEIMAQADSSKEPFAFPCGGPKDGALASVASCSVTGSGGSARTDYRAIQLAKKRKQKSPAAESGLRKTKAAKAISSPFGDGSTAAEGSADLVTGSRFVQIQLLQDDPAADGDLAFQLTSQTSCSHSQLTVDLPVNILQEPNVMAEEENGSEDSQFTSSTINLQDLE